MLELSPEQRSIVDAAGHVVVIAGPGAGKTRTVVAKIGSLLQSEMLAFPFSVLAVTFTDAAARELRGRLARFVPASRDCAWCGTFHSFGGYLLRAFGRRVGVAEDFIVADRHDVHEIRETVTADHPMFTDGALSSEIEKLKRQVIYPGDASSAFGDENISSAYAQYQQVLLDKNMLDFNDLVALSFRLLRDHEDIRALVRNKFRYTIVDEFQDTDSLQLELVTILASGQMGSMVVADDDQAIFSWRGAVRANVQAIQERLGSTVWPLVYNFRSRRAIVSAATALINRDDQRNAKILTTDAQGGEVLVRACLTPDDEAAAIVQTIERLVADGRMPHEIAIISRARYRNDAILGALQNMTVPWFDRDRLTHRDAWETNAVLALVRLSLNHDDGLALGALVDALDDGNVVDDGYLEACAMRLRVGRRKPADSIADVQDMIHRSELTLLIARTKRVSEQRRATRNLASLTRDLEVEVEGGTGVVDAATRFIGEGAVQFATGHAVKGREFDSVFMMGLEDDVLPSYRSKSSATQLAEERRIFYVALTRARLEVRLSFAQSRRGRFGMETKQPSRFIADLPRDVVGAW